METKLKDKKEKYSEVEHKVANFVDDSKSLISFLDPEEANNHINWVFVLLIFFYTQNKLVIKKMLHQENKSESLAGRLMGD